MHTLSHEYQFLSRPDATSDLEAVHSTNSHNFIIQNLDRFISHPESPRIFYRRVLLPTIDKPAGDEVLLHYPVDIVIEDLPVPESGFRIIFGIDSRGKTMKKSPLALSFLIRNILGN